MGPLTPDELPGLPARRRTRQPEMHYKASEARSTSIGKWVTLYSLVILPAAFVIGFQTERWVGLAFFGAGVIAAIVHLRGVPDVAGVTLRVDGAVLTIERGPRAAHRLRVTLANLRDVQLDTRTAHYLPGPEGGGGGSIDVSRIVFVFGDGRPPLPLTDNDAAHMQCVEWAGKIRVFLRSHGWLPDDERIG